MKRGSRGGGSPASQIRALLVMQIDRSLSGLQAPRMSNAIVHGVRQDLKRARATARLIREVLGKRAYRRENAVLRDAARSLSVVRDAAVLVTAFAAGRGAAVDDRTRAFQARVSALLQGEGRVAQRRLMREKRAAIAALRSARRRIAGVSGARLDQTDLGAGAERVYRRGRRAARRAACKPTDEALHECRKQAKYLFNQLDALAQVNPRVGTALRKQSRRLTKCLGEDHDLAVLQQKVLQEEQAAGADKHSAGALRAWSSGIDRRRAALQRKALVLSNSLYAEPPRRFSAKIRETLRAP